MAVENSSLGLKYIGIANVDAETIPATYQELEDAQIDSASLTESEPATEDIRIEQKPGVYRTITTAEGTTVFTVQLYDMSTDTLALLKGGTVTPPTATVGKRYAKKETFEVKKALKLVTLDDFKIFIPNGKVSANVTWTLAKSALATVTLTITAQDHLEGEVVYEEPLTV